MMKVNYKVNEDFENIIDRGDDKVDLNTMKRMTNFATLPYNSSLIKLGSNLQSTLESLGYKVERDEVKSVKGSYGEQIQEIQISFFGSKRIDFQGKVGESKSLKPLLISLAGLILFSISLIIRNFGIGLLAFIFIAIGIYLFIKVPNVLTYTYVPAEGGIWIKGSGHGIHGTRRQEIKEGSNDRSHAKRYMESTYIQCEADLKIGATHEKEEGYYTEKILSDEDKREIGLFDLIKGLIQKKNKLTVQDETKYKRLPNDAKEIEKNLNHDFKELKESLKKFS